MGFKRGMKFFVLMFFLLGIISFVSAADCANRDQITSSCECNGVTRNSGYCCYYSVYPTTNITWQTTECGYTEVSPHWGHILIFKEDYRYPTDTTYIQDCLNAGYTSTQCFNQEMEWNAKHFDYIILENAQISWNGGAYIDSYKRYNPAVRILVYSVDKDMNLGTGSVYTRLQNFATANGYNIEDAFLHLAEPVTLTSGYVEGCSYATRNVNCRAVISGGKWVPNPKSNLSKDFYAYEMKYTIPTIVTTDGNGVDGVFLDMHDIFDGWSTSSTSGTIKVLEYDNNSWGTGDNYNNQFLPFDSQYYTDLAGLVAAETDDMDPDETLMINQAEYFSWPANVQVASGAKSGAMAEYCLSVRDWYKSFFVSIWDNGAQIMNNGKPVGFSTETTGCSGGYSNMNSCLDSCNVNSGFYPSGYTAGSYSTTYGRAQIAELSMYYIGKDVENKLGYFDILGGWCRNYSSGWIGAIEVDIGKPIGNYYVYDSGSGYTVFARDFTKGLVLYRPRDDWSATNYGDTTAITFNLPGTLTPVEADGSLMAPTDTFTLRNAEAVILLNESGGVEPPPVSASVYAGSANVDSGQTFNVYIGVDATQDEIFALQFDLNYDSSILHLNSVGVGPFLSSDGADVIFNYSSISSGFVDNIYVARNKTYLDSNQGLNGNGDVVVLSFTALSVGTSPISLSNVIWVNSSILNASAATIIPAVTDGGVNVAALPCTLTNAYWSATNVMEGTPVTLTVTGDNCDGQQMSFLIKEYDIDPGVDDDVTTNPSSAIFVGGVATTTWNAEWQDESLPETLPPEYYFTAEVVSDPGNTIQSNDPKLNVDKLVTDNLVFISPSTSSVDQYDTFNVEIRVQAPVTASDIYGLQFDFDFDPTKVVVNGITEGPMLSEGGTVDTIFNYSSISSGKIDNVYVIRNLTTQDGDVGLYSDEGVIATISLTAIGAGTSTISLSNVIWVNSTIDNKSVGVPGIEVTNGTLDITASSAPSSVNVSLYSPQNLFTTTNSDVTFYANVSADNYIANATLWSDASGVWQAEETKTPSVSGTVIPGNVLLYHFDNDPTHGETPTYFYDYSGNGNDGTGVNFDGDEITTAGKYGGALDFDGTNDYVNSGDMPELNGLSQFTVSAWIYPEDVSGSYKTVASEEDLFFLRKSQTSTKIEYVLFTTSSTRIATSIADMVPNQWQHVLMTYNGTRFSFYYNGVYDSGVSLSGVLATSGNNVNIGKHSDPTASDYFNGMIDEVYIYNRSLTPAEITALYNNEASSIGTRDYDFNFTKTNIPAGNHKWNVKAYDNLGNSAFAPVNYTFTVDLCGNGVVDSGEQCDGTNLNGQTCVGLGYEGGNLGCTSSCTFDTGSCTSSALEYYVFNEQLENGGTFVQGPWTITSNNPYEGPNSTQFTGTGGWMNMDIGTLDIPTTDLDWDKSYIEFAISTPSYLDYVEVHLRNSTTSTASWFSKVLTVNAGAYQIIRINLTELYNVANPSITATKANFGSTINMFRIGAAYGAGQTYIDEIKIVSPGQVTCTDADTDGFYLEGLSCGTAADCNDTNTGVNPDATEICDDLIDNDCDGAVDMSDSDCGINYDINHDGQVNIADVSMAAMYFGNVCSSPDWCGGRDVNRDAEIDIRDLSLIGMHFT